jgi:hypothetical protein
MKAIDLMFSHFFGVKILGKEFSKSRKKFTLETNSQTFSTFVSGLKDEI